MIHTIRELGFPIPTPPGGIGMIHTGTIIIAAPATTVMIHHVADVVMMMIIGMIIIIGVVGDIMMTDIMIIIMVHHTIQDRVLREAIMVRPLQVERQ
jgi:hypothetical protein